MIHTLYAYAIINSLVRKYIAIDNILQYINRFYTYWLCEKYLLIIIFLEGRNILQYTPLSCSVQISGALLNVLYAVTNAELV